MKKDTAKLTDLEIKWLKEERAGLATSLLKAQHPADCEKADKALEKFDIKHPTIRNMR